MKVDDFSARPALGVGLKITAILLFTCMSAIIKSLADDVPAGESVFFRSFFAIPVILIWLAQRGKLKSGLKTKNPMGHVWRGLFGTTAMGLTFTGLGLLPLPEVTAIGFATPIFTVILAAVLLGEQIRLIRVTAVAMGLVGVMIILWPRFSNIGTMEQTATIGALLILMATMVRSLVQIHIRQLVQNEDTAAIVFYFSCTASLLALCTLPFGWVMPDLQTFGLLVLAGLIGGVAQILITSAYRFGSASMLAPYDYTSMLFAIVLGYVFFAELPTMMMLAGAALVISAGALVIWRERQLGMERGKARSVTDPKA
ncbi:MULTISPECIES: DMT family transporter [Sulfitobacter]|jgi:drug/metabolite transporter (DMT)-like permease|uniref:Riboflavin transporter n=1 Tax=Sulfitobacter dubius TaxID=218673 RepID=A0ABY3ZFJ3_9RHOB|nr:MULTISPECIES: DMT family transporter [Sulfitobacter]UOA13414.1 Riboflavin transporter [Sulfitobacter dubius]UWR33707.1 DMT family transporter [Sulfitobacter sp. W027]WOI28282.1 DMT family transporter [Sulfitobacter dubius]